jgi:hypothetical protein
VHVCGLLADGDVKTMMMRDYGIRRLVSKSYKNFFIVIDGVNLRSQLVL